jgi:UDPglucose 6-dehydrogenase
VRALHHIAGRNGYPFQLLRAVIEVNNHQKWHFFQKIKDQLGDLADKKIGVWGVAFKPNTDDVRESIALEIINRLVESEAQVSVYDPEAMANAKKCLPAPVRFCDNKETAAKEADCLLIITEWDEFKNPDFAQLKDLMKSPLIIDGRNIFDPAEPRKFGFTYLSVGR